MDGPIIESPMVDMYYEEAIDILATIRAENEVEKEDSEEENLEKEDSGERDSKNECMVEGDAIFTEDWC